MSGQAIRTMRFRRDAIYHLLVQDEAGGLLPCKFFHGGYLEGRLKPGQLLILHGKAEIDKLRPARLAEQEAAVKMIRALLAGDGVPLGWTAPSRLQTPRPVPVIVAGSGPKTLRMAGRSADGAVIRIGADPALVQWGYDEFCAGAREAGRDPAALWVAGHFHTVLTDDVELAEARGRVMAAGYYEVNRGTWERLGLGWPCAPIERILEEVRPDFHHAYDMALAAKHVEAIPVEVARRFCLMGSAADVRLQLEGLVERFPWMRHVILQPNMPGPSFIEACGAEVLPAFR
jgi:alkanesulfonate monooxygenase SsuD/methylene tetrahydromethanopterin reductase-like flavin-dependent oxidoreductase (luciferase family)